VHAEDEHRQPRHFTLDVLQHLEAAAAGQPDIEDDDVPLALADEVQGFLRSSRLAISPIPEASARVCLRPNRTIG
jgi:hypothetical protein